MANAATPAGSASSRPASVIIRSAEEICAPHGNSFVPLQKTAAVWRTPSPWAPPLLLLLAQRAWKLPEFLITEAGRELADPAGVAASAIRRMSPFCFFLELWNRVGNLSPMGTPPWGQTSLLLMYGRFWGAVGHFARRITFEVFLRMPQGAHFGVTLEVNSGPFRKRIRVSFWS